ncbi:hypothetical protein HYV98_00090 [Candidatus Azambacteria bacterium]|nr:hypothetical protein [Candidatus Azambacteria bacterium]
MEERTWGSETSQYPEEQKPMFNFIVHLENEGFEPIPAVAASEKGGAQTCQCTALEISNPKSQITSKSQIQNSKYQSLEFKIWKLEFVWYLVLVVWYFYCCAVA